MHGRTTRRRPAGGGRGPLRRGEAGSALLVTMAAGALVSALAGALVAVVMIEEAVEANHRRGVQALYAADGLLAGVVAELAATPDWAARLAGPGPAGNPAGSAVVNLPDGSVVDVAAETRALSRDGHRPGDPAWRVFARGWLGDLAGAPDRVPRLYLLAWVRRGPADPDGPSGGSLVVRAAAFGAFRVERAVEATVVRDADAGVVRVAAWHVVRQAFGR